MRYESCTFNEMIFPEWEYAQLTGEGNSRFEGLSAVLWLIYPPQAWLARHQFGGFIRHVSGGLPPNSCSLPLPNEI
jgi:hypothetical protein